MPSPIAHHLKKFTSPRNSTVGYVKKNGIQFHLTPDSSQFPSSYHPLRTKPSTCAKKLFGNNSTINYFKPPISVPIIHLNNKIIPSVNSPDRHKMCKREYNQNDYYILGKGSYGVVILSEYKGETMATKIVHITSRKIKMSLIKELNSKGLLHPNVVRVIDVILNKDYGFIIMEPMPRENLQNLINKCILPLEDKVRYLKDISNAISYCHICQILHLDIKPKNILVNETKKMCKICDFGNSCRINDTGVEDIEWQHQGTVIYSAPELLRGEMPTEKCDVYSIGITIWQILYQETPYEGLSQDLVTYSVVSANSRPYSKRKCTTTEFKQLYEKCWHSNPSKRPTATEIGDYLKELSSAEDRPTFILDSI